MSGRLEDISKHKNYNLIHYFVVYCVILKAVHTNVNIHDAGIGNLVLGKAGKDDRRNRRAENPGKFLTMNRELIPSNL